MEQHISASGTPLAPAGDTGGVSWQNLREWIALLERSDELQHIKKSVDADEELSAITYMATRSEKCAALLFENVAGDTSGARILANMLGSSRERYALAVGLDPDLSISEMNSADPRNHEPAHPAAACASVQGAGERNRTARR